jgi:hypothetical protein
MYVTDPALWNTLRVERTHRENEIPINVGSVYFAERASKLQLTGTIWRGHLGLHPKPMHPPA